MPEESCRICGNQILETKEFHSVRGYYCKQDNQLKKTCKQFHYICFGSTNQLINEMIFTLCMDTGLSDPDEIDLQAFDHLGIPVHGPQHHFLISMALTVAYLNSIHHNYKKEEHLKEKRERSERIPGGFCWTYDTCGAAIIVGMFISVIIRAQWFSEKEWQLSNMAITRTLKSIAKVRRPRCCKRVTFISSRNAQNFLEKLLQGKLSVHVYIVCHPHDLNKECFQNRCMFHF
ncbi:MAG TPA: DUF5714 domain-containing protein [Bacteroidales bacterium]|jgi:hypothetical protein|nr:MAG: hypothetical protein BWX51_01386 [Bacteroidetes bacterium ADurb.Bin012]HNQ60196.1 DUF5714 domain-containing protein [Bacteroidales bacterium]HNU21852.1 DUF5714 domain-containing protein [Bacteroidales bacterium]HNV17429.1 DUF5714 domain-containing protein [Bacteroidales bacterium]HNZ79992.1 DUF5714 domain-containing protein [Bacteroidales bacterium]